MGEETAVAVMSPEDVAVAMKAAEILSPENSQMYALARVLAKSDIIPKDMQKKPSNVFLILMKAQLLGISPVEALENVMVVNGRSAVWGDLFLALIQRSPNYEWHREYYEGTFPTEDFTAICEMKRRGIDEPFRGEFSVADAKMAKLWGGNVWAKYPKDMLKYRARTRCGRGGFADALKGVTTVEEARDIPRRVDVEVVPDKPGTGMAAAAALMEPTKRTSTPTPKPPAKPTPAPKAATAPKPKATAASKRQDAPREAPAKKPPADNPPPSTDEMAKVDLIQSIDDNCKRYGTGTIAGLDKFDLEELRQIAEDVPKDGFIADDPMFLRREAEKATAVSTKPSEDQSTGRLFEE